MKRAYLLAAAAVLASSAAFAQGGPRSQFSSLEGSWVKEGYRFVIDDYGYVSGQGNTLNGTVGDSRRRGSNFAFYGQAPDGRAWECSYFVNFLANNTHADWGLRYTEGPVRCPEGYFERGRLNPVRQER